MRCFGCVPEIAVVISQAGTSRVHLQLLSLSNSSFSTAGCQLQVEPGLHGPSVFRPHQCPPSGSLLNTGSKENPTRPPLGNGTWTRPDLSRSPEACESRGCGWPVLQGLSRRGFADTRGCQGPELGLDFLGRPWMEAVHEAGACRRCLRGEPALREAGLGRPGIPGPLLVLR